jgi:hypothetical protein
LQASELPLMSTSPPVRDEGCDDSHGALTARLCTCGAAAASSADITPVSPVVVLTRSAAVLDPPRPRPRPVPNDGGQLLTIAAAHGSQRGITISLSSLGIDPAPSVRLP